MILETPLHPRTSALSLTGEWRNWSGYLSAAAYEPALEPEYYALRNAAGLLDVSPLFKYEVRGPEAARLLDRAMTRDIAGAAIGGVLYTPWCDDDGKVIDDGTVHRLAPDRFLVTAADPSLRWLEDAGFGFDAEVEDVTAALAALALQGPRARAILAEVATAGDVATLGYYRLTPATIAGVPVTVSRTGYTGDLGYEIWIPAADAVRVWDALVVAGAAHGLLPVGLAALDVARVEAGLLLIEVDYVSARRALTPEQTSSPFELGLGWAVPREKKQFIGRKALLAERERGSRWALAGLEVEWTALERLFAAADLPPQVAGRVQRAKIPAYRGRRQVGYATSLVFSPLLKRYVALATLESAWSALGTPLELEVTIEHSRRRAPARVVAKPFFDPPRKRS